jgi:hypothetical protein
VEAGAVVAVAVAEEAAAAEAAAEEEVVEEEEEEEEEAAAVVFRTFARSTRCCRCASRFPRRNRRCPSASAARCCGRPPRAAG